MKRFIMLIVILICFSTSYSAESAFEKGSKSVGGNFLYSRFSGEAYPDQTILDFNPRYSVCLTDGFFLGVVGQLRRMSYNDINYSSTDTEWRMGFIGEWYQPSRYSSPHPMVPYFRFSYLFGRYNSINAHSFGFQIGALQMITKSTGLDFGIQGALDHYSQSGNSNTGFILMGSVGFTSFIF